MCEDAQMMADPDQEAARRFVQQLMDITGWTPTGLARAAGLSHTTLTRLMKPSVDSTLSSRSLSKLKDAVVTKASVSRETVDHLWLVCQQVPAGVPLQAKRRE